MLLQHIDSLSVADAIIQNAVEFSEIVIRLHCPFRIGKRPPVFRFFVKRRLVLNIQRMDIRLRIINKTDAAAAIGHFLQLAHVNIVSQFTREIIFPVNRTGGNHEGLRPVPASGNIKIINQAVLFGQVARQDDPHRILCIHPVRNGLEQTRHVGITFLKIALYKLVIFFFPPRRLPVVARQIFRRFVMRRRCHFPVFRRRNLFRLVKLPQNQQLIPLRQRPHRDFLQIFQIILRIIIHNQPRIQLVFRRVCRLAPDIFRNI